MTDYRVDKLQFDNDYPSHNLDTQDEALIKVIKIARLTNEVAAIWDFHLRGDNQIVALVFDGEVFWWVDDE